jgi:aminoglycoside phosphotransferase (APT) family kinase protein
MIPAAAEEARWRRLEPRRHQNAAVLERIVGTAFPGRRLLTVEPLIDGIRNSNFKLHLNASPNSVVLRLCEHEASLCQKEVDLLRLVGGSVPVAELLHAEPRGWEDTPPFILTRYVEAISFRDLKRSGDTEGIAQAAYSVGETLAAIGRITFDHAGWVGPGPAVTKPLLVEQDRIPRLVDLCLEAANLRDRMPPDLRKRVRALTWSSAPQLADLEKATQLCHGDFSRRNLLVHNVAGRWSVAAVLDWEFAIAGSPLVDLDNFLRYERVSHPLAEPHFSAGYVQAGGNLPPGWLPLARLFGLASLCESLARDQLPQTVIPELVELVRATLETFVNSGCD